MQKHYDEQVKLASSHALDAVGEELFQELTEEELLLVTGGAEGGLGFEVGRGVIVVSAVVADVVSRVPLVGPPLASIVYRPE
ncbi:hypothetical protein [Scytonema sp. PCC 10023]|uniref:hypothetical protein n=1 Tax=Scytonema sp. PCC 10023 TaxID=1680591 RepID=UPI0039C6298C